MKTKSKLLAFGIILSMLFSMTVMPAHAAIVDSGTCGENLTWTLDDEGTLTISGTGDMTDYSYPDYAPWYNIVSSVETVIIPNGVTSIGDYAFYHCNITSITIPDSITSIGRGAFSDCYNLTSISIGNGVTSIEHDMFAADSEVTNISIGNSVTNIEYIMLTYDFRSLTGIEVSQNNQTYSSKDGVLFNKDKTTLVAYPRGKTGSYTIPNSVTSIENYAFFDRGLTSITIPNSVTDIGNSAFDYCYGLKDIYYSGTYSEWNSIRIKSNNDPLEFATIHYGCVPTSVTISGKTCTDDSIKLISHMIINPADTPTAFGTTFIPLWLFSDPSATPATVEYSVSEYPVVSGDTFGATLAGIPDGYQDVYFVGKSYIRLDDESVVWSNAKKVKIEENALRKVE